MHPLVVARSLPFPTGNIVTAVCAAYRSRGPVDRPAGLRARARPWSAPSGGGTPRRPSTHTRRKQLCHPRVGRLGPRFLERPHRGAVVGEPTQDGQRGLDALPGAPQLVELVGRLLLGLGGLAPDRSRGLISRVSMRSHIYMRSYRPAVSATMVGEPEVPAKRRNVYLRHRRQQHTRGKPGSPSD
jgi:hypothetical protein